MWNFEIEMPQRNFQFRKHVHQTRKTRLNNSINIIFKMFTIKQIVVCLVRNRTTLSYLTKDLDVNEVFGFRHVELVTYQNLRKIFKYSRRVPKYQKIKK